MQQVVARCNAVIHAGDIGSASVIQSLEPNDGFIFAVIGNNDVRWKWPDSELDVLESLPLSYQIAAPGGLISVEHGHLVRDTRRYHEVLRNKYSDSRLIVYGHTHNRVFDDSETPWVLNPGAAGRNRTRGGPSCAVLEIANQVWKIKEYRFSIARI